MRLHTHLDGVTRLSRLCCDLQRKSDIARAKGCAKVSKKKSG